jgi:hypothetical protein
LTVLCAAHKRAMLNTITTLHTMLLLLLLL